MVNHVPHLRPVIHPRSFIGRDNLYQCRTGSLRGGIGTYRAQVHDDAIHCPIVGHSGLFGEHVEGLGRITYNDRCLTVGHGNKEGIPGAEKRQISGRQGTSPRL